MQRNALANLTLLGPWLVYAAWVWVLLQTLGPLPRDRSIALGLGVAAAAAVVTSLSASLARIKVGIGVGLLDASVVLGFGIYMLAVVKGESYASGLQMSRNASFLCTGVAVLLAIWTTRVVGAGRRPCAMSRRNEGAR